MAMLMSAGIEIAGQKEIINHTTVMLLLLPVMLGVICLCCLIYAYECGPKGDPERNPTDDNTTNEVNRNA